MLVLPLTVGFGLTLLGGRRGYPPGADFADWYALCLFQSGSGEAYDLDRELSVTCVAPQFRHFAAHSTHLALAVFRLRGVYRQQDCNMGPPRRHNR